MSRGTLAFISGLGVLSILLITIAGVVISLGGQFLPPVGSDQGLSFDDATWESLMRTLDAGTMGGDEGWGYHLASQAGDPSPAYGVHTNLQKSTLAIFTPQDKLIVLAEG